MTSPASTTPVITETIKGTVVRVPSSKAKAGALPGAGSWFGLGVMVAFDTAEDSEYHPYDAALLDMVLLVSSQGFEMPELWQ